MQNTFNSKQTYGAKEHEEDREQSFIAEIWCCSRVVPLKKKMTNLMTKSA